MNSFRLFPRRPVLWAILVSGSLGVGQASAQSHDLSWRAVDRMVNLQRVMDQRISSLENATIYSQRNPSYGAPRTSPYPGAHTPLVPNQPSQFGAYPPSLMPAGPVWHPQQPAYDVFMDYRIYDDGIEWRWIAVPR